MKANDEACAAGVVTTAGDMVVATGANALARLAAVASGQVLTAQGVGVAPAWAALPAPTLAAFPLVPSARVTRAADQTIATSSTVPISFDTERWDTDSIHESVTNPTRLTATRAGIYLITAHVQWASNTTGTRTIQVGIGGSSSIYASSMLLATAIAASYYQTVATVVNLAAGEWVAIYVNQASGGNLNLVSGVNGDSAEATMTYLGRQV